MIQLNTVAKHYSEAVHIGPVSLELPRGGITALVGPNGAGKSTLLTMIGRLLGIDEGTITVGGADVSTTKSKELAKILSILRQENHFVSRLTVRQLVAFGRFPHSHGHLNTQDEEIITRYINFLGLDSIETRYLDQLSGGQRQRVAMGRAIVRKPQVFLMDEPLSNLDAKLRVQTRAQISTLQRRLKTTTVYVTHDQTEALTMGDRIAVLSDGILYQVGTPDELYNRPANVFVAGFIGSPAMNLGEFRVSGKDARLGNLRIPLPADILRELEKNGEDSVVIGIRPEAFEQVCETECPGGLPLRVDMVENLGSDSYIYATAETDDEVESDSATKTASGLPSFGSGDNTHDSSRYVVLRVPPTKVVCTGSSIWAVPYPHALHFFHATNGLRIGHVEKKKV